MASVGSGLPSHKSTIVKQLMSNGIPRALETLSRSFDDTKGVKSPPQFPP
jgi:hypothetical protein